MTNNNINAEMIQGELRDKFWDKEGNVCIFNKNLLKLLAQFHHVDTYYRTKDHISPNWRVQGWIYTKDLPQTIPQQMIEADCQPRIRHGKPVIEIWSMIIISELPF